MIAPDAIFSARTVPSRILEPVTALSAILEPFTAPVANFSVVTALFLSLAVLTASSAIFGVVTAPDAMCSVLTSPGCNGIKIPPIGRRFAQIFADKILKISVHLRPVTLFSYAMTTLNALVQSPELAGLLVLTQRKNP